MNDPVVTTLVIHGVISCLLAVGGGLCLYFGFKLLFNRKTIQTQSTFEAAFGQHKITFTAGAAGTAVVLVSAIWVAGSVIALPHLSQTSDSTTVAAAIPFQGTSTTLEPVQKQLLDAIGPTLTKRDTPLQIEVYANHSSDIANKSLALQRAEAVKNYLTDTYKIRETNISVVSPDGLSPDTNAPTNSVIIRTERSGN